MAYRKLVGVAALLVALAACAQEGGSVRADPSAGPVATTELTITVNDGHTDTTWHLTCGPDGGDHPDPTRACAVLAAAGAKALPPVPKDMMCTQQYGGPETARILGTWAGRPVDAHLSQQNGCEIARWRALAGLLP